MKIIKTLTILLFLLPQISHSMRGNDDLKKTQNAQVHLKRLDPSVADDCRKGMQFGAKMGKSPMGKFALGAAGAAAGVAKNYIGNTAFEKCKAFMKMGK